MAILYVYFSALECTGKSEFEETSQMNIMSDLYLRPAYAHGHPLI